ncbi:hypothetical protein CR103_21155 [Massilia psychrophila]|uniref:Uncharacterized protein n=2 Tax=Massilia psychrophila TaxID=1603353 RepID=A0A2G8SVY4_9BURK|nr:hypothetical protein CR103_21155 [Massilia psychrophila]
MWGFFFVWIFALPVPVSVAMPLIEQIALAHLLQASALTNRWVQRLTGKRDASTVWTCQASYKKTPAEMLGFFRIEGLEVLPGSRLTRKWLV